MYVVAVQCKSQFAVEEEEEGGKKVGRGYLGRVIWVIWRHLML